MIKVFATLILVAAALVAFFGCTESTAGTGTVQTVQVPESNVIHPVGYRLQVTKPQNLVLNASNTLTFRGPVTPKSAAQAQLELLAMSRNLPSSAKIYLVLDTPGGDIVAGRELIDTVRSIPQEVKTITVFAASMGFQFVQHMGERLILPSGTLMSHRATLGGLSGEIPGELITKLNFWHAMIVKLDAHDAARMGMSLADYQELIRDEYWVDGQDAVADKAADRMVLARCDASFDGTTQVLLGSVMGIEVYGIMNKCPLITAVMGIQLGAGGTPEERTRAKAAFENYSNRRLFFRNYTSKNL